MPAAKEKTPAKSGSQTARQQREAVAQPQAPQVMAQDSDSSEDTEKRVERERKGLLRLKEQLVRHETERVTHQL